MAGKAIITDRGVRELQILDCRGHILVTAETELVASPNQIILEIGGVRVMTIRTVLLGHYFVHTRRLFRDHVGVADGADFPRILRQQLAVIRSMGIMAA